MDFHTGNKTPRAVAGLVLNMTPKRQEGPIPRCCSIDPTYLTLEDKSSQLPRG